MMRIVSPLVLLAVMTTAANAQFPLLQPGDTVRITAVGASGLYEVREIRSAGLTLIDSAGRVVHVPASTMSDLDVSRGRRSAWQGAKLGASIGLAIGGGTGMLLGFAAGDDPSNEIIEFSAGEKALALGLVFGGSAAIIGALIGASAPGERWESVPFERERAAAGAQLGISRGGGVVIGYTARF